MRKTNRGYVEALRLARAGIARLDPTAAAFRADVPFDSRAGEFTIEFFGDCYRVCWPAGTVRKRDQGPTDDVYSILLLHYLLNASGLPVRNRWVSVKELPGGALYQKAFRGRTLSPFVRVIERGIAALSRNEDGKTDIKDKLHMKLRYKATMESGERFPADLGRAWLANIQRSGVGSWGLGDFGDISFFVRPLPRVPLGFVYWAGCAEEGIPSSGAVLFDESAPTYLPTEDLIVLADLGVRILKNTVPAGDGGGLGVSEIGASQEDLGMDPIGGSGFSLKRV